jgi:hypothetical protein
VTRGAFFLENLNDRVDNHCTMKTLLITLFTSVAMIPQLTLGAIFNYELLGLPKESNSCIYQSQAVATQFEKAVQVKVVHTEPIKESETDCDFSIEYEANQRLEFTSTMNPFIPKFYYGRYASKEECEANLPIQKQLFEKSTLLNPVFSYCTNFRLSQKPWGIALTALGSSKLRPLLGKYVAIGSPKKGDEETVIAGLREALEKKGAVLADWIFKSGTGIPEFYVHYYAENVLDFFVQQASINESLEVCLDQENEAKSWAISLPQSPFSILCQVDGTKSFILNLSWVGEPQIRISKDTTLFNSFLDCQNQKSETLKFYQGSALNQLLGGFCSRKVGSDQYQLVVFKVKKV